jgi:hypothetical protein
MPEANMTFRIFLTLSVGLVVALSSVARADKWPPPKPRIFAQRNGVYAFKTLPDSSEGVYFTLDERGEEKVIWRAKLVNIPVRAILAESAKGGKYVITLDTWGRIGHEHCLVVYGEKGKVIADFKLEDLLTAKEIESLPASVSSRGWSDSDVAEFDDRSWHDDKLIIRMKYKGWAKVLRLTLSTGKLVKE